MIMYLYIQYCSTASLYSMDLQTQPALIRKSVCASSWLHWLIFCWMDTEVSLNLLNGIYNTSRKLIWLKPDMWSSCGNMNRIAHRFFHPWVCSVGQCCCLCINRLHWVAHIIWWWLGIVVIGQSITVEIIWNHSSWMLSLPFLPAS